MVKRSQGDLACLLVSYFIGQGFLVMFFLGSEYARLRLEGCTVTPYLHFNAMLLFLILFVHAVELYAMYTDDRRISPVMKELKHGTPLFLAGTISLILGALTVVFSLIYTVALRSCT